VTSQNRATPDDVRGTGSNDKPTSLMEQFGRTKSSFSSLLSAHIALFKAEIGEILDQIKVMATLAGVALGVLLLVGNMLYIGGFLFMGEWLFGSIGWGLAHGVLFGIALVAMLMLGIVGAKRGAILGSFMVAVLLIVGLALLTGSNVGYNSAASVAASLVSPLNSAGVVALLAGAVVGALLFALLLWRVAGGGGAIGGLFVGAILGMLVGWLIAGAPWTWPPAVGFSITIGLIAWPILAAVFAIPGLDMEARFGNLYPKQSIEAVNESRAWLEEQWAKRQPKLRRQ
jgi:hypothetical protein